MFKQIFPVIILALLCCSRMSFAQVQYKVPDKGWLYIYDGNVNRYTPGNGTDIADTHLDGTWEEGGKWDLSGIGDSDGLPGGVDVYEYEGVSCLRIQDPGNPGDFFSLGWPEEPNNDRIQFYHALTQDKVPEDGLILDDGVTLAFRIKVPVEVGIGKLDSIYPSGAYWTNPSVEETWPYPAEGDGDLPFMGHGMIGIHQADLYIPENPKSIGFSLMTEFDDNRIATSGEGLYMNSNFGNHALSTPSPFLDNDPYAELEVNHIDCNPRVWNEFWVQIVKDTTLTATHLVKIWMNGDIVSPHEFHVTASVRAWRDMPHMYMGFIYKKTSGAVDIDYYGFQLGLIDPAAPCEGVCFNDAVCIGDTLNISYTHEISANTKLAWNFEEASFVDTTDLKNPLASWDEAGYKTISLSVQEDGDITDIEIDSVFVNGIMPTPTVVTDTKKTCGSDPVLISYAGTATPQATYDWDFDNGNIISGEGAGPYEISWSNTGTKTVSLEVTEQGCSSDTSLSLEVNDQPQPVSICMVSIDSSNHNMIVWERPENDLYDFIKIYRQTSQADVYEDAGMQPAEDVSVYIDSQSNPAQNSDRYKIAVIDTEGCESTLSDYHKTLHLTISTAIGGAWNLIWEEYEGFEYSTYNIYRGTSLNELLKIAEQSSNTFTFTDLHPPTGTVYYVIEIELQDPCNISDNKSSNSYLLSTRSNIASTADVSSGENSSRAGCIIHPNPFDNFTTIQFHNPAGSRYKLSVLDLSGKVVYLKEDILTERIEFFRNGLPPGIYLIELAGPSIYRGKIVIE